MPPCANGLPLTHVDTQWPWLDNLHDDIQFSDSHNLMKTLFLAIFLSLDVLFFCILKKKNHTTSVSLITISNKQSQKRSLFGLQINTEEGNTPCQACQDVL